MNNPKQTSFEIQVLKEKRWVLSQVVGEEASALAFADNLLSRGNYEAVRVVRDFKRADGLHAETVVLEKTGTVTKPEINISPVSDAPLCQTLPEFYTLPARLTIGRVLRKYLDEAKLTPTELLHHGRELKRLADKDRLLMNAVDNVAAVQVPGGGEEGKARRDFLHKHWEQVSARARNAAPERLPKGITVKDLLAITGPDEGESEYRRLVILSAVLAEHRDWLAKLGRVLFWAGEAGAEPLMPIFDGLVADLLMPAEAIQDLMGFLPNLSAALCHMCDLAEGTAQPAKNAAEFFGPLCKMMGEGRLAEARGALLSRVVRELRGSNPLSRSEPSQEYEAFVRILSRLVTVKGVFGGPLMAESLALRTMRRQTMGGLGGLLAAIDEICATLGARSRAVVFLTSLANVPKASESFGPNVLRRLTDIAEEERWIEGWVAPRLNPRERMEAMCACHRTILADTALPEKLRLDLAGRADIVLARYLEEDQVIEKIDKPEDPLAFRALRLVKFCASGVLIKGKSLELAHKRVLGYLRQPSFEEKFLASIPDQSQAEKHLREFHKLLMESGFKF